MEEVVNERELSRDGGKKADQSERESASHAEASFSLDTSAMKKADKMLKKTEEYRTLFNLPEIDFVVQDYHCGFWRGLPYGWWQGLNGEEFSSCYFIFLFANKGRLLITSNHVLFRGTVGDFALDVKLRDLVSVEGARSLIVVNNALDVFTKTEKLSFGTFVVPGIRFLAKLGRVFDLHLFLFCFLRSSERSACSDSSFACSSCDFYNFCRFGCGTTRRRAASLAPARQHKENRTAQTQNSSNSAQV
jgi:hypothetical protein